MAVVILNSYVRRKLFYSKSAENLVSEILDFFCSECTVGPSVKKHMKHMCLI